ncbi:hypothetical protein QTP70_020516, partial [Hemibagrus guttatus]
CEISNRGELRSALSPGRTMFPMSSLCRGVRLLIQQHAAALECCSVPCTRASSSSSSLHVPPPACMLRPLEVPFRYLFGPGPSNVSPRVLSAGGRPIIGHQHPEMFEIMNDIKEGIRYAFQTSNLMTLAMSGSGHTAMECAVFNVVEPGESVLVSVNGVWGERVAEIAERMGAEVHTLVKPPGGHFSNEEIEKEISKHKPVLFFLTHGESSAGLVHPVDGIGDICRNDVLIKMMMMMMMMMKMMMMMIKMMMIKMMMMMMIKMMMMMMIKMMMMMMMMMMIKMMMIKMMMMMMMMKMMMMMMMMMKMMMMMIKMMMIKMMMIKMMMMMMMMKDDDDDDKDDDDKDDDDDDDDDEDDDDKDDDDDDDDDDDKHSHFNHLITETIISTRYNCLLLVDSVASLGASPLLMDQQKIDILYTGSQKALNAPPGTAPISFNERACQKMFNRKTKPVSYLLDMTHLSNYWGNDGKAARMYHHTGPVSGFFSLRESLSILTEKGLENSWRQHREVAEYLWKGLEDLGLQLFIKDKDLRLPSVTTITIPEGYDWKELLTYMMKHHQMEMTGGLGPSIGLVLRVGLMGYNCNTFNADKVLAALADALKHCKKHKA